MYVDWVSGLHRLSLKSGVGALDDDRIRALQGTRYSMKYGWTAPLTWSVWCGLQGEYGQELELTPTAQSIVGRFYEDHVKPLIDLHAQLQHDVPDGVPCYPYQEAGAHYLALGERIMLNDEAGSGKTIQTIRALQLIVQHGGNPFPAIVVAPSNMVMTWREEIGKWWPGLAVQCIIGKGADRTRALHTPAHIYVINYENLHRHSSLAGYGSLKLTDSEKQPRELNRIKANTVIVDEAHRIKDPKSKQCRAVWSLGSTARYRYALTATPIAKSPADMWSTFHFLEPDVWTSRNDYIGRYCATSFGYGGHIQITGMNVQHRKEFWAIMAATSRRMLKKVILPQLPPKVMQVRKVEMSSRQKTAYNQLRKGMVALIGEHGDNLLATKDALSHMMRMWQLASSNISIDGDGNVTMVDPSSKLDAMMDIIDEMAGDPLVVFAESRQLIERAAARLTKAKIPYMMIIGGLTADQRQDVIVRFRDGKTPVLLCTIKAAKEGNTFTAAGTALFLQRSWSSIDNSQAEDRVHRIGAEIHDEVDIIDLVAPDTIETRQRAVLRKGYSSLTEVMRDTDQLQRLLGQEE